MLKVAVVHDWLTNLGGAERVLEQILAIYPDADLYAIVDFLPEDDRAWLANRLVKTSFIQAMPFARRYYRAYLPLMPLAISRWDFSEYDRVLSSSYAVVKGIATGPDQLHVSYVHSPMRYAWDLKEQYLEQTNLDGILGWPVRLMLIFLRKWDKKTAERVNYYMANSDHVAERIRRLYDRKAQVVYPPVATDRIHVSDVDEGFFLVVSRLVPYKRVDLIAEAFSGMENKNLVIIGDGPEMKRVKAKAGANVKLLGRQSDDVVRDHLRRCHAFVFAALEDFGIAPLEAQACGKPVIAFAGGGCLETLRGEDDDAPTAVFFKEQSPDSLRRAVERFEATQERFSAAACRENALRFSPENFRKNFSSVVKTATKDFSRPS